MEIIAWQGLVGAWKIRLWYEDVGEVAGVCPVARVPPNQAEAPLHHVRILCHICERTKSSYYFLSIEHFR